jgi:hypothetical protein
MDSPGGGQLEVFHEIAPKGLQEQRKIKAASGGRHFAK